ncbi:MAG: hypothetical protein PHH84_09360 [Oscillospiraceae bacterium]|nr:hypothetical protein [Oscillospiraceae bacterium]
MSSNKRLVLPTRRIGILSLCLCGISLVLAIIFMTCGKGDLAIIFFLFFGVILLLITPILLTFVTPALDRKAVDSYVALLSEVRTSAKLIVKSISTHSQPSMNRAMFTVASSFDLTFELPDKKRICFKVNEEVYNTVLENDEGLLMYKEDGNQRWFIKFQHR